MTEDQIICLSSAGSLQEAYVWSNALQAEGIRCRVVGDYLTAGYGLGVLPNMHPEVWIHREDLDRARAVLKPHLQNRNAAPVKFSDWFAGAPPQQPARVMDTLKIRSRPMTK